MVDRNSKMARMTRLSQLKRSDRLRAIGWLVLVSGWVSAAAFYGIKVQSADLALDDATALGYTRSLHHEMGVMMGQFGLILTEWEDLLTSPMGETLMIAAGVALLAAYFFRVAWVLDQEEER
ncbi:MAG: hypothetical protein ACRD2I_25825 [Vicinamibacterales bacterium]